MTPRAAQQLADNIEWIRALAEGKTVQRLLRPSNRWEDIRPDDVTVFTLTPDRYRIKPEPRKYWLCYAAKSSPPLVLDYAPAYPGRYVEVVRVREVMDNG